MHTNRNEESPPFSILTVCTGNICRSPLAEQLLRAQVSRAGLQDSIEVASAGLQAVVGSPMDSIPAELSAQLGGEPAGAAGRALTAEIAERADVILAMSRMQRDEIVHRYPRLLRRAFTLVEFAKLLALEPLAPATDGRHTDSAASFIRERSGELSAIRSRVRLSDLDDVADPFRRPRAVHEAVANQIALATADIAHGITAWAAESRKLPR